MKMKLLPWLLLIYCMAAFCRGHQFPCSSNTTYDPYTQLCCNKAVVAKEENRACCSGLHGTGQLYNTDEKICCGEKVFNKTGSDLQCCADQTFDHDTTVCCNGKLHPRKVGAECCGESYLDTTDYLCCNDRNKSAEMPVKKEPGLQCCGNKPYDSNRQKCSRYLNVLDKNFDECGKNKIFDMNKSKCCAGRLHYGVSSLNQTLDCCHTELHDVTEQKCCFEGSPPYLIPNSDALKCCPNDGAEGFILKATEICCPSGRQLRKSSNTWCCGNGTYERGEEGCCGEREVYNSSQQCCPGKDGQYSVASKDTNCCGGRGLKKNEICCHDQPVKKGKKTRDVCNYPRYPQQRGRVPGRRQSTTERCGDETFDPTRAVCCEGKVHHVGPGRTWACCGVTPYDTAQSECRYGELLFKTRNLTCNGMFYPDTLFSEKCCGSGYRKYNQDNQTCCENAVFNISPNEARCCDGKAYSVYEENPCSPKCGKKSYSPANHTCCGDELYKGKRKCCGNRTFRPTTQHCCEGGLVLRKKEGECCGPFPFSKKFGSCDEQSETPNTRGVTSTDLVCERKQARNILNAVPAACVFTTVLKGTVTNKIQDGDSLNLTLINVRQVSVQLAGGFQGKVPSRLLLQLPPPRYNCRLKRRRSEMIVMLGDNGTEVSSEQDLRTKPHYIMRSRKKIVRDLQRPLSAGWCEQVCKRLSEANEKPLGMDRCYRSMKTL